MPLQEGIYHDSRVRPGRFFGILFLRATGSRSAGAAGGRLSALWQLYQELKLGHVPDLAPASVPVEHDNLTVLVGYGPNAFTLNGAVHHRPSGLSDDQLFASPRREGGGPLLTGSGLAYAPEVVDNRATEDFCIQAIADTKLAVDRLIVETWKHLHDNADPATGVSELELTTFYLGAQRSDRRSWIDFHDGLSNMRSADRQEAITIKRGPPEETWCVGGSYLAFLRLSIDLPAWRRLDRVQQELLVGRDKLTGCPLTDVDDDGRPQTDPACPVAGTQIFEQPNDAAFAEPPRTGDPVVLASHVQRANHHRAPTSDPGSRRIFRQGYEFLEWAEDAPRFRAGLNFVSFQDTTERVIKMLTADDWLGHVNFGGDPDHMPPGMGTLLGVYAGGVFLVPPTMPDGGLPGASLLGQPAPAPA